MIISLILARGQNNVIGKNGDLPWHLPADQKYFKEKTYGHFLIMGRKTFESLGKKTLPGRPSIVITRQKDYEVGENCHKVNTLEEAISLAKEKGEEEAFVIGGAEIYRLALPYANRIYLTEIQETFNGDTFSPDIDYSQFKVLRKQENEPGNKNPYPYTFLEMEKISNA